jgi:hypothetical protein
LQGWFSFKAYSGTTPVTLFLIENLLQLTYHAE